MLNSFTLIFILMYVYSYMMVMGSDDWFLIWMGLEINMLSFLFLFYRRMSVNNIESCIKYFFIQSLGSGMFVVFVYLLSGVDYSYISIMILGYKLGAGPFFFWFPSVIEGLEWMGAFFLMSFQKILPLVLLMSFFSWMIWVMLLISLVVGVLGSFNQKSIKVLFAYSSIHHIGWMLICGMMDKSMWFIYLLMYMMMLVIIVLMLYYYEINSFVEVVKWGKKWWFVLSILSMGGMPPFLGFFLSWLAFYYILKGSYIMLSFMVVLSVVMFYVYVRVVYDIILGGTVKVSWFYLKYVKLYFFNLDLFMVLGMLFGSVVGLILVV